MSYKRTHPEKGVSYFITFTCHKWINLIHLTQSYNQFYKWFDYLNNESIAILAYVIMPNHFHGIIHLPIDNPHGLNKLVANAKRFIAYHIITTLKKGNFYQTLKLLTKDVSKAKRIKGQNHVVFKPSFDAKVIRSKQMFATKLHYIHINPCNKNWQLVDEYWQYKHSSASYYEKEVPNSYISDYTEFL